MKTLVSSVLICVLVSGCSGSSSIDGLNNSTPQGDLIASGFENSQLYSYWSLNKNFTDIQCLRLGSSVYSRTKLSRDPLYNFVNETTFFGSQTDCDKKINGYQTIKTVYQPNRLLAINSSQESIEFRVVGVFTNFLTQSSLNNANATGMYGYSDYVLNEYKDITNKVFTGPSGYNQYPVMTLTFLSFGCFSISSSIYQPL